MDKIHIDLININDPSKGFTGFVSFQSRTELIKRFTDKTPFTLKLLNGCTLLVSKEMMEVYTATILTEEASQQVVANFKNQGG